jgi:hypothetical protein
MTSEAVRIVMHQNVPFRIKSADGSVYDVPHPDFVSVSNSDKGFLIITKDESFVILSLPNVTAVEIINPAVATADA